MSDLYSYLEKGGVPKAYIGLGISAMISALEKVKVKCPRCGIKMKRRSRNNISEDYCPRCGMIFGYIQR